MIPKATIERVLGLFEDDYSWPVDWSKSAPQVLKPDDHHFHWAKNAYGRDRWKSSVPYRFRELPTNRGIVPRQFHNVIHYVTVPPRVPHVEDMKHYLRSFEIAKQLFVSAERASCVEGLLALSTDEREQLRYLHRYEELFETYSGRYQKALGMGAFRVMGIEEIEPEPVSFSAIVEQLGSCGLRNAPNYTALYFEDVVAAA